MIEAAQTKIMRNLVMITFGYVSYLLVYSFAGYPWWTYFLYVAIIFDRIICHHFVKGSSKEIRDSVDIVFNDPENLDELIRQNISDQLNDPLHPQL